MLLAEVGDELWAAFSLQDGHHIADPLRPSADAVLMLGQRARQLHRRERRALARPPALRLAHTGPGQMARTVRFGGRLACVRLSPWGRVVAISALLVVGGAVALAVGALASTRDRVVSYPVTGTLAGPDASTSATGTS